MKIFENLDPWCTLSFHERDIIYEILLMDKKFQQEFEPIFDVRKLRSFEEGWNND